MGLDVLNPKILNEIKSIKNNGLATPKVEAGEDISAFSPVAIGEDGKLYTPKSFADDTIHYATQTVDEDTGSHGEHPQLFVCKISNTKIVRILKDTVELVKFDSITKTMTILDTLLIEGDGTNFHQNPIARYDEATQRLMVVTHKSNTGAKLHGISVGVDGLTLIQEVTTAHLAKNYRPTIAFENGVGIIVQNAGSDKYIKFELTDVALNIEEATQDMGGNGDVIEYSQFKFNDKIYSYSRYYVVEFTLDSNDYTNSTINVMALSNTTRLYAHLYMFRSGDILYGVKYNTTTPSQIEYVTINLNSPTIISNIQFIPFSDDIIYLAPSYDIKATPIDTSLNFINKDGRIFTTLAFSTKTTNFHRVYEIVPSLTTTELSIVYTEVKGLHTTGITGYDADDDLIIGLYDQDNDYMLFYNLGNSDEVHSVSFVKTVDQPTYTTVDAFLSYDVAAGEQTILHSEKRMYGTNLPNGTVTPRGFVVVNGVAIPKLQGK